MIRAWLALLLLLSAPAAAAAPPEGILTLEPHPGPDLEVSDADGNRFSLEAARGNWVFVHFWASWCVPCRREMPSIQRMQQELGAQGPRVVLINTAEDADTIFFFLAEVAPALQSFSDRTGRITEAWQPRGLPATYLVDPHGNIRYQALGGRPWDAPPYLDFLRRLGEPGD